MTDGERTFVVEAGHIMMFDVSLGGLSTYDAGAPAPLTFTQASAHYDPQSALRPRPGQPWKGSGKTPTGVESTDADAEGWLHAEQHFEYVRHVRAGDKLTATTRPGKAWTKRGSSGVGLTFVEEITEFRDATGAPAVVSRIVRVRRDAS